MTGDRALTTDGPKYEFPSLDDLLSRFRRLAQSHPDRATFLSYGQSRGGEPLWALRLGGGPRRVLAYAFPQPDEPLGGIALLHIAGLLLEDAALRRPATWLVLPCVDPDGARHNEGWFTRPLDLAAYARQHFRPPEGEQVDWSFPSDDPDWPWDRPLPETRALQALIDEFRPQVLVPLHNSLLGGAYAFLSAEAAALAPHLAARWEARGLPTHQGEPELPFAAVLAPGIYRLPELEEIAAALAGQGVADPPGLLQCGAPAYRYARRCGAVVTVVPELPLFTVPGVADTRPVAPTHGDLLRVALNADRAAYEEWAGLYAQAVPLLGAENPFRSALEAHRRSAPPLQEANARWLATDASLERPATVAEQVDCLRIAPYLRLLPLGLLGQALAHEAGRGTLLPVHLAGQVAAALEEGLGGAVAALDVAPVALDMLVEVIGEIVLQLLYRFLTTKGR